MVGAEVIRIVQDDPSRIDIIELLGQVEAVPEAIGWLSIEEIHVHDAMRQADHEDRVVVGVLLGYKLRGIAQRLLGRSDDEIGGAERDDDE